MIREALVGHPVDLPQQLAADFPELSSARYRAGGIPPRVGGWFLGHGSVAAITLWDTVWLAPRVPLTADLLLHEVRHVHQFQAVAAFPLRYLWESLRRGYHRNRYEADAREYARARLAHGPADRRATDV